MNVHNLPAGKAKAATATPAEVAALVHDALDNAKAVNITELNVVDKTSIADYMVIACGTSTRHLKTLADTVVTETKQAGLPVLGVEGDRDAEWVLVDLADVLVHLMLPRARAFYNLEKLWDESPSGESSPDEPVTH